jgi:hypothetical protein
VASCPDMVPSVDHRLDRSDLPQRSIIHHGAENDSAVERGEALRKRPPQAQRDVDALLKDSQI